MTNDRWELVRVIDGFENNGVPDGFNNPTGFVTEEGHIYVADTDNSRLVELDPEGKFVGRLARRNRISSVMISSTARLNWWWTGRAGFMWWRNMSTRV